MSANAPLLIFAHANSFPASTYGKLFAALQGRGLAVQAIPMLGHDPDYPVTNNWPHLVQQLVDFALPHIRNHTGSVYWVGHSLGGFLSLMAAALHPELAQGVVLVDAPIVGGWRASLLGFGKRTALIGSLSPGAVSRKRVQSWEDEAAALRHFQGKKNFARWDPEVLADYIHHGTHDEMTARGTRRVLSFQRDIETRIYNTLPDHLDRLFKKHPLQCPVSFIGGRHSREMRQAGQALTEKLTQGRMLMLDGGHLVPMEKPLVTAAAIETAVLNLDSLKPTS